MMRLRGFCTPLHWACLVAFLKLQVCCVRPSHSCRSGSMVQQPWGKALAVRDVAARSGVLP
jgi:hypothetical protein